MHRTEIKLIFHLTQAHRTILKALLTGLLLLIRRPPGPTPPQSTAVRVFPLLSSRRSILSGVRQALIHRTHGNLAPRNQQFFLIDRGIQMSHSPP